MYQETNKLFPFPDYVQGRQLHVMLLLDLHCIFVYIAEDMEM